MVVWFAHVRVGHRQLSIPENPPPSYLGGGFSLFWVDESLQLRGSKYAKTVYLSPRILQNQTLAAHLYAVSSAQYAVCVLLLALVHHVVVH